MPDVPNDNQIKHLMLRAAAVIELNAEALRAGCKIPGGRWGDNDCREAWVREKALARQLRRYGCAAWNRGDRVMLELQYIGACALLAKLSPLVTDEVDRQSIRRALNDLVELLPGRFEVYLDLQDGMHLCPVEAP